MPDVEELLEREDAAWQEFVSEVGRVPQHVRDNEGVVPGWSVNDLVYHVGKWAEVGGRKLELIKHGRETREDDDFEDANQVWARESKSLSYEQVMTSALEARERTRSVLEGFETVDHEVESWFKEETTDHYLEHAEEVARFADSLGPGDAGFMGQAPGAAGPGSAT